MGQTLFLGPRVQQWTLQEKTPAFVESTFKWEERDYNRINKYTIEYKKNKAGKVNVDTTLDKWFQGGPHWEEDIWANTWR